MTRTTVIIVLIVQGLIFIFAPTRTLLLIDHYMSKYVYERATDIEKGLRVAGAWYKLFGVISLVAATVCLLP